MNWCLWCLRAQLAEVREANRVLTARCDELAGEVGYRICPSCSAQSLGNRGEPCPVDDCGGTIIRTTAEGAKAIAATWGRAERAEAERDLARKSYDEWWNRGHLAERILEDYKSELAQRHEVIKLRQRAERAEARVTELTALVDRLRDDIAERDCDNRFCPIITSNPGYGYCHAHEVLAEVDAATRGTGPAR